MLFGLDKLSETIGILNLLTRLLRLFQDQKDLWPLVSRLHDFVDVWRNLLADVAHLVGVPRFLRFGARYATSTHTAAPARLLEIILQL
jgi:hypothetical protein